MKGKRVLLAAAVAAVALLVSACTITIRPSGVGSSDHPLNNIIEEFRPTIGSGATYRVGDNIEFRLVVRQAGFITLSAMDPDGRIYTFARNIPVERGVNFLPTPGQRVVFTAGPPRGLHFVRASFTSGRTDSSVTFTGRSGGGEWNSAINLEIRNFPVRDVAETSLRIR
ncbi:MAG: DUF4384 domain-containing protein [Trueperaceae bacterium]